jgi:regulatory protein
VVTGLPPTRTTPFHHSKAWLLVVVLSRKRKSVNSERAGDPQSARSTAVSLLARRDFASGELRGRLERKGFDAAVVASTISELLEEHALDDARYTMNYVSYEAARGRGPLRIAAELKALELPVELIDTALAQGPDWRVLAHEVRSGKFGLERPSDWTEKARQARFLQYRGFSSDHIRSALGADIDLD